MILKEKREMTEQESLSEEDRPSVKTILVVEDDADIGEFLVQAVQQETPYQALLASDGFQALKMLRSIKPNLFLLDYHLPSMDGLELYDHIHATEGLEAIPTLFMSASAPVRELEQRRVYLIKKPFELTDLLDTL